ncbi:hypothetical protein PPERSA_11498 [Pseudocohnilembus persalinus]|uniref:STEEP1 domain-containing protein n=1 Tax=Pseudocohnilembus persalinus TaxID=266149 RepID=A0A0V0QY95_PSEPJ|nr:hypothetical protein PPERSA_11498 [Pseudocohnilembus persalinus]|eukprot:KRX06853.1 hypothetical protein PPERSA_11498 [Pseudocohnilembus persalinus]
MIQEDQEEQYLERIKKLQEQDPTEKVTLADLKHKRNDKDAENFNESERFKLKNFTSADSQIQRDILYSYYCSLCGIHIFTTNFKLKNMPKRQTDKAVAVFLKKQNMVQGGLVYIQRDIGIEQQYRWKCQCGVIVGYQSFGYEHDFKQDLKALISEELQDLANLGEFSNLDKIKKLYSISQEEQNTDTDLRGSVYNQIAMKKVF